MKMDRGGKPQGGPKRPAGGAKKRDTRPAPFEKKEGRYAPDGKRDGRNAFGERREERPAQYGGGKNARFAPAGRNDNGGFKGTDARGGRSAPDARKNGGGYKNTDAKGDRFAPTARRDSNTGFANTEKRSPGRFAPPPRRDARPVPPRLDARPIPPQEGDEAVPRDNLLLGRNPIREAIKSGRDLEKLLVAKGDLSGSAREIVAMARERRIIVQVVDRERLSEIAPNHQGMIAFASAFRYAEVEDMLQSAKERGEPPLLVILDGVTDPHNLGAIIRSAECAGAHGVIVPERRAVGLTPAAVKASAGAVEYLPVARTGNLTRLIESLKEQGIWICAADMAGEPYNEADLSGPLALVVGAEGTGVSRLVAEHCDRRVALPVRGKIESLNASVAAGVLLYEVVRQRGAK